MEGAKARPGRATGARRGWVIRVGVMGSSAVHGVERDGVMGSERTGAGQQ